MSIEYCHFCEKHIDTDFDIDHGHISEAEIERYYTTREAEKEDYECSQDYIDYINESAIYHAGGYVYE